MGVFCGNCSYSYPPTIRSKISAPKKTNVKPIKAIKYEASIPVKIASSKIPPMQINTSMTNPTSSSILNPKIY